MSLSAPLFPWTLPLLPGSFPVHPAHSQGSFYNTSLNWLLHYFKLFCALTPPPHTHPFLSGGSRRSSACHCGSPEPGGLPLQPPAAALWQTDGSWDLRVPSLHITPTPLLQLPHQARPGSPHFCGHLGPAHGIPLPLFLLTMSPP